MYLDGNALCDAEGSTFQEFTSLEKLYLYDIALSELHRGMFEGLSTLKCLVLHNNTLRDIQLGIVLKDCQI